MQVPDGVGMSNEVLSKMDISVRGDYAGWSCCFCFSLNTNRVCVCCRGMIQRKYKDYSPRDPEAYLQQTLFWSQKLAQSQQAQHGSVERNEL